MLCASLAPNADAELGVQSRETQQRIRMGVEEDDVSAGKGRICKLPKVWLEAHGWKKALMSRHLAVLGVIGSYEPLHRSERRLARRLARCSLDSSGGRPGDLAVSINFKGVYVVGPPHLELLP